MLTLNEIEKMSNDELTNLKKSDYKHLGSMDKMQVDILLKTKIKQNNAHKELMNTNGSVYTNENTSVSESENAFIRESVDINTNESNVDLDTIAKNIVANSSKKKSTKFEDTHTKSTYWIQNDVLKALNAIGSKRGEKTKIINNALIDYFRKLESELEQ